MIMRNKNGKKILLLAIVSLVALQSCLLAQDSIGAEKVIAELKTLQTKYETASTLSFNIEYKYTNETAPEKILDSISGFIQLSNHRCHWQLSNTEMVSNEHYGITLFKEDKVMYITRPPQRSITIDPMDKLDGTLLQMPGLECAVEIKEQLKTLSLFFPQGSWYKSIQFFIDNASGYMVKSKYVVKSEALTTDGKLDRADQNKYDAYAIVEVQYFNYTKAILPDSIFEENNYFTREDKNFTTTPLFREYKIFIGSPNL
jgi:hypothetical protein